MVGAPPSDHEYGIFLALAELQILVMLRGPWLPQEKTRYRSSEFGSMIACNAGHFHLDHPTPRTRAYVVRIARMLGMITRLFSQPLVRRAPLRFFRIGAGMPPRLRPRSRLRSPP